MDPGKAQHPRAGIAETPDQLKLNCLVSDTSLVGVKLHAYRFQFQTSKEIDMQRMGYAVSRALKGVFTIYTGGQYIYTLSDRNLAGTMNVEGIPTVIEGPITENFDPQSEAHRKVVHQHLKNQIVKRAENLGYELQDRDILYKRASAPSRNIESHDAMTFQVTITPAGRVLLFVDVQKRWICPITSFIESLGTMPIEERNELLRGMEVMVHVTDTKLSTMRIVDYRYDTHGTHVIDPTTGTTLFDFWNDPIERNRDRVRSIREKLGYTPKHEDVGVYILAPVGTLGQTFAYPPQVLRLKIDLQDAELLKHLDLTAEKMAIAASERESKIDAIFRVLSNGPMRFDDRTLDFSSGGLPRWGTLDELGKDGYRVATIDDPVLEFAGGATTRFLPGEVNRVLEEHGPYSGPLDIIVDFLIPPDVQESRVPPFFDAISTLYARYRLGRLKLGSVLKGGPGPYAYGASAHDFYLDLQARRENLRGRVLLAVLPMEEQDECHKAINRELLTVRVPCKCMVRQTFFGFQRTTRFHLYNIIACIYERSLEVGEGMWILRDGAGNRNDPEVHGTPEQVPPLSQVYIGFDVSRVRGKPEVASYAAICEPHGRVITTQDKSFSGEYLTSTDVEQIITSTMTAFQPARRRLGLPLTGEIVFFKDGTSRGGAQERELEAGLERTAEALIGSGRAMRGLSVNYVDVTKGIIHRIFSTGRKVPQGTAIINEDFEHPEVIIVTTDPFGELSHQPNRLTLRKSIGPEGMADIRRIARQYYDLRFLHFETWRVQPGAALPLHIVQNKAKQRAYGYDTVYIPK